MASRDESSPSPSSPSHGPTSAPLANDHSRRDGDGDHPELARQQQHQHAPVNYQRTRTVGGMPVRSPPSAQQEETNRVMLRRKTTLGPAARVQSKQEQHAYAGGAAGLVAGLLLYPAETVSMRYKVGGQSVFMNLIRTEGPLALWAGIDAGLVGTIPTTAMYFVAYNSFKEVGEATLPERYHPLVHMFGGATSELMSSVVYVPFEVVKARMQLGRNPSRSTNGAVTATTNYKNSLEAMRSIWMKEGRRGLYAGYGPCIITDTSFRGFQFLLYEMGKKRFGGSEESGPEEPSTLKDLAIGAGAGALAAVITNPFDVVTVRLMTRGLGENPGLSPSSSSSSSSDSKAPSVTRLAFMRLVAGVRREGVKVLFDGAFWRAAALAPHSAVTFAVFEAVMRALDPEHD